MADSGSRGVFFIMIGVSARIDSAVTSAASAIYSAFRIGDGHSMARSRRLMVNMQEMVVVQIRYMGHNPRYLFRLP